MHDPFQGPGGGGSLHTHLPGGGGPSSQPNPTEGGPSLLFGPSGTNLDPRGVGYEGTIGNAIDGGVGVGVGVGVESLSLGGYRLKKQEGPGGGPAVKSSVFPTGGQPFVPTFEAEELATRVEVC